MKKVCFILALFILMTPISAVEASAKSGENASSDGSGFDQPVSNDPGSIPPDQTGSGSARSIDPIDKTSPTVDDIGVTADLSSADAEKGRAILESDLHYVPLNEQAKEGRSLVAVAAESLVDLSETVTDKNVGEQIRVIAREQAQTLNKVNQSLDKIEQRSKFSLFFFGPDYKRIRETKRNIIKNNEQIRSLRNFRDQLSLPQEKSELFRQIAALQEQNVKISEQLNESTKESFSLLGWLFKRIYKQEV